MSYRVLISDAKTQTVDHELQSEVLADYDATVTSAVTREEDALLELLDGVHGLISDAGVPVTRRVIETVTELRVVGRAGIGVDNVDLQAAAEHDITVVHHPTYCIDEVATHALSLLLACLRGIKPFEQSTQSGEWDWTAAAPISRLQGSTLGLLGFGKVPRRLVTMVQGFGLSIIAHDPYVDDERIRAYNVEPVSFETLCERSSLLSIHPALTPETRGMVDASALARLSADAILVNTARGPIIDIDALIDVLEKGKLSGVGLDVVDPEPPGEHHPLLTFDRVIVTPHAAWYSEASRSTLSHDIADDVGRVLNGEEPRFPVVRSNDWLG